jgi:hypothetical protein
VKGAAVAVAALAVGAIAIGAFAFTGKPTTGAGSPESRAKRAADAIATRDPKVMRQVADEMDAEGAKDLAEGLRMAADLAMSIDGANR